MNNRKKAAVLATALFCSAVLVAAAPGSAADPLVTKSYVDAKDAGLMTAITSAGSSGFDVSGLSADEVLALKTLLGVSAPASANYVPVLLQKDQLLLGGEGTEVILRTGSANAVCPGINGLVDMSDGTELFNAEAIPLNHNIIIPREDGRGIAAAGESWLMVRGGYTVK